MTLRERVLAWLRQRSRTTEQLRQLAASLRPPVAAIVVENELLSLREAGDVAFAGNKWFVRGHGYTHKPREGGAPHPKQTRWPW